MNSHSPSASIPQYTDSPFAYFSSTNFLPKFSSSSTWLYSVLAVIATILIFEQINYRKKKAGLPGSKWTLPIIGKFADSLNPTLEGYINQWNSGALSALSVFHMYVLSILLIKSRSTSSVLSSWPLPMNMPARFLTRPLTPNPVWSHRAKQSWTQTTGMQIHFSCILWTLTSTIKGFSSPAKSMLSIVAF